MASASTHSGTQMVAVLTRSGKVAGGDALRGGVVHLLPADDFEVDLHAGIGGLEGLDLLLPEGRGLGAVFRDHEAERAGEVLRAGNRSRSDGQSRSDAGGKHEFQAIPPGSIDLRCHLSSPLV